MHPLLIVLAVLGGILFLLLLLILLGTVKVRIVYREKVRVVLYVLGIGITLVSDREKKPELTDCHDPEAVLRREKRKAKKAARKAAKKAAKKEEKKKLKAEQKARKKQEKADKKAAGVPAPNVVENLQMILALLKKLYTVTRGRFHLHVKRLHITVGTDDAAKTAMLYGMILQSATCILQWLQTNFIPIHRKDGSMEINPDFITCKTTADVDILCSLKIRHAIGMAIRMLMTFLTEKKNANKKAARRVKQEMLAQQAASQGN